MLYIFKSRDCAEIIMLEPNGRRLLEIIGKEPVPKGIITQHKWSSKVFPGTERDYWLYVPAQYDGNTPACVMVFQDGNGYGNVQSRSLC